MRDEQAKVSYYCMGGLWDSPMVKYATSTFPITHLIPPKILYNLCFSFLLGITTVPRETENNTYANFFWRWGGWGGGIRCIMGNVEVLKARRPWGRGWRICWFSVEKRQNGGWITQNELRGHSTPSSKSSIVKMICTLIMRRQRPTYQTYTLILFNETNSQPREDWARFSRLG